MPFPPLGNYDHVVVSVSIDFPSNSKRDALFHYMAYDCCCPDWDGLHDHLKVYVYITHGKYQVKPCLSTWFSAGHAAGTVHKNHFFFVFIIRINVLNLK